MKRNKKRNKKEKKEAHNDEVDLGKVINIFIKSSIIAIITGILSLFNANTIAIIIKATAIIFGSISIIIGLLISAYLYMCVFVFWIRRYLYWKLRS